MKLAGLKNMTMALVLLHAGGAGAEVFLDAFTAKSFTRDADVRVDQRVSASRFTVEGVSFDDESFRTPPWYGLRAGYFLDRHELLGVAVEFFHFKVRADTSERKRLRGTVRGEGVDAIARVDSVVGRFDVSHGVNYLTLDGLARYPLLREQPSYPRGRIQPYAGVGLGAVIAHPENEILGVANEQAYELGGFGVQAFTGVRAMVLPWLGVLAEYKFTRSSLDVGIAGGDAEIEELSHHLLGGITITFPWPGAGGASTRPTPAGTGRSSR